MRGGDAKPPRQPLDVLDAVLPKRRGPLPLGCSRVARSIPCLPALPAQGAQRLTQKRSFIVAQALNGPWLVHDIVLRIDRTDRIGRVQTSDRRRVAAMQDPLHGDAVDPIDIAQK